MDTISIIAIDNAFVRLDAPPSVRQEIADHFTFMVPGAQFMPAYKNKVWDGRIRLVSQFGVVLAGLVPRIMKFAESRDYKVVLGEGVAPKEKITGEALSEFFSQLGLPANLHPRKYQLEAFVHSVRHKRCVLVCPTASGKSLIMYMIAAWLEDKNILVIVPTTSLVLQMKKDFEQYGCKEEIHVIMGGYEKHSDARITISTWQSLFRMPVAFFKKFDVVLGDEAHLFKAKSLEGIMNKMPHVEYRIGLTGTLDGAKVHELQLIGLFGEVKRVIRTSELIRDNHLSDFEIKCLILQHPEAARKAINRKTYQDEIKYIVTCRERNNFLANLTVGLKGNSLVLYNYVEHGKALHTLISNKVNGKRDVFLVYGSTEATMREQIREVVEKSSNAIVVASFGTFSTGVNIRNLHNIVFASPTKSRVRSLQSIGRGLRKGDSKEKATLYDISDELSNGGTWTNHTLKHFLERLKIYDEEGFAYLTYRIQLNG